MRLPLAILLMAALAACSSSSVDVQRTAPSQTAVGSSRAVAVSAPRFGDYKPHPWDSRAPYSHQVHGVDVSRWQGDIDWPKVAGDGIDFAYIKATEGRDFSDRRFTTNWTAARAAGLEVGAYHYFTLCSDAAAQADHFLETAPSGPDDLPPVVDLEDLDGACDPSAVEVRSEVQRFVAEVERRTSGNAACSVGPTSTDGSSGRPTGGHG